MRIDEKFDIVLQRMDELTANINNKIVYFKFTLKRSGIHKL